jgi:hypothetical protein
MAGEHITPNSVKDCEFDFGNNDVSLIPKQSEI